MSSRVAGVETVVAAAARRGTARSTMQWSLQTQGLAGCGGRTGRATPRFSAGSRSRCSGRSGPVQQAGAARGWLANGVWRQRDSYPGTLTRTPPASESRAWAGRRRVCSISPPYTSNDLPRCGCGQLTADCSPGELGFTLQLLRRTAARPVWDG